MTASVDEENDIFGAHQLDFVPPAPIKPAGVAEVDFDRVLSPPLKVHEDLKNGCGGQLWPAGMVLGKYMLRKHRDDLAGKTIVELGAGGGLVGLAVAVGCNVTEILHITDQDEMFELMKKNIALNDLSGRVEASIYDWGQPTPANLPQHPDVILAADCVYFEPAFPLLQHTLKDIIGPNTVCYFCFKRRRRADLTFMKTAGKMFDVQEVDDDPDKPVWSKERLFLSKQQNNTNPRPRGFLAKMTAKYTIHLVYLTSFLFLFGETLQPAPRIAIYESIICQQHYGSAGPHDCKIAPVQEELAFLGGIERLSIIIPSVLAIPFAALADRYGHSLILAIAMFGIFLEDGWPFLVCWFPGTFPIRLIWLHFVFSSIGGGFTVVVTLLHVIIADVVSAEERTRMFFRARAAGVGASIVGYTASGLLMKTSEFLPWAVGLASLVLGTISAVLIPRATVQDGSKSDVDDSEEGWSVRSSLRALKDITALLIGNKQVLAMLLLVFVCQMGFDSVPLMLAIYVSKRFGWSFSNASFLSSLEMGVEFLALAFVLPVLTSSLPATFQRASTFAKDKIVAQWSLVALSVGTLCLGIAPVVGIAIAGIVILALGSGQDSLTRSMATEMVHAGQVSTMYSAITMLRAIGGSISGPVYAWLYSAGLKRRGDIWLGLPYLVAGALFITAMVMLTFIHNTKELEPDVADEEAREPLLA
ncbi:hypothetical protein OPT61_g2259 [Boeremia exigua]|uniref:Uncharacterized protein n=1 Tax=Boeremia exigua TaxID=749465 RepID=A0ACC2IMF3_9PLEO|nr:hypothetical protein OPT61_g2259 [Boeremia exigua]